MTSPRRASRGARPSGGASARAARDKRSVVPVDDRSLLRFLVRSAEDLNSTLDLDEVLAKVAERIKKFIDFHLFCVMLWNEEEKLLEHSFSLCHGELVPLEGGFPLGTGISGTCAERRAAYRVPDVSVNEHYVRQRHPHVEIRSELAVPLIFQERLVGVLDLESAEPDAFSEEHEVTLTALASHVAIAIENARLYDRLEQRERRLEQELTTAREIQESLLSGTLPRMSNLDIGTAYQPVTALGGDFYDFLPLGAERMALCIGDVAGKGTAAALYGSMAVGLMRGHIVQKPCTPREMLEHLDRELHARTLDNRFVAMTFGVFDGRDRTLCLANGGFTQPILMRGGRLERLPVRGMPLGLLPGVTYDEHRVQLEPGDAVAFVSDGLQEAIDGQERDFGDGFLEDVMQALESNPARQIAEGLLRASTAYAGVNERSPDDRSVVVLKVS
jgi:sigma-B regulation protein RsbU (phosphoserine phosphatase)